MTVFYALTCLLGLLPIAAADSGCTLDLGFVVDTTGSIGRRNVPKLRRIPSLLVQQFDVSENGTHVSLETFARRSTLHNKFSDQQYYSNASVQRLIEERVVNLSLPTRVDRAIQLADEQMFTRENGDRPGVQSVMVLLHDGRSHPKTNVSQYMQNIRNLKSRGVRLIVIAIGPRALEPQYRKVLEAIPGEELFSVHDYDQIDEVVSNVTALICPPRPCNVDLAFVVDRTKSVGEGNFTLAKGFLVEVTNALTIGPDATHTGFILFARQPEVLSTFADSEYYSNEEVEELIETIPISLESPTFIDRALNETRYSLFTEQGGDRPDFPNLLVLITDGKTNRASAPFPPIIDSLEARNVRIVVIGVGRYEDFRGQLEEIAGGEDNIYNVRDFDELSGLFTDILEETCDTSTQSVKRRLPDRMRDRKNGHFRRRNPNISRKLKRKSHVKA